MEKNMKYRKYLLHLSILIVLLFSITAISAADLNDTATMDSDVSNNHDESFMAFDTEMSTYTSTFDIQNNYKFDNSSDLM